VLQSPKPISWAIQEQVLGLPETRLGNPFSILLLSIVYHVSPRLATAKATVRLTQVAFTTFA